LTVVMIGQKGLPPRYGGVETHVDHLARRLAAKGHRVWVFCRSRLRPVLLEPVEGQARPERREDGWWYEGVRLRFRPSVPTKHLDAATHCLWAVVESALAIRPDLVHLHGIGPGAFAPLARVGRMRVVCTVHALDWRQKKWEGGAARLLRLGERFGVRASHRVVAVSRGLQRYLEERYGVRSVYIPNGAVPEPEPPAELVRAMGLEPGRYLLTVGRLIPDRRIEDLLEAFRRLEGRWQLAVVGEAAPHDPTLNRLRARADDRVRFLGAVYGRALTALYAHCRLYVLPSAVEGLPITVCEAMAQGKGLLLSDIPENQEVAGEAARYFPVGRVDRLADLLARMVGDEELLGRLGRLGRERVEREYHWDRVAEQVEAVYREVLEADRRA
jgi:glycosyltransferase involved in cell wall biosynthesis